MSTEWGRIDADGTVYVTTADGEREIGSWQAGDVAAGLAYYQRKYADLATEVTLLEKRLASGAGDPASTRTHAKELTERIATAAAIGNLAVLTERIEALLAAADAKAGEHAAARKVAREKAIAAKQALVEEAEKIGASGTSWKLAGDRLRNILEEWKQIHGIDRKTDDALWKRFCSARDGFSARRVAHFSALDAQRGEAKKIKQKLVEKAESLSQSSDWKDTALAMRDLMGEWKAAPRAARDVEDALWKKFRAAQDAFFDRRSGTFAERDAEQIENQKLKEAIVAQVKALSTENPKAAQSALRGLQDKFEAVGHVPRDAIRRIDEQMHAAEQRIRDAVDAQWQQVSVAANPFLAAMRERLVEAEAKLERARKTGDQARIAKAEADVAQRRALLPN